MRTISRSSTLAIPTEDADDVYLVACRLMDAHWKEGIRFTDCSGSPCKVLTPKEETPLQLDLFSYEEQPKKERLITAMIP